MTGTARTTTFEVTAAERGLSLQDVLARRLHVSRNAAKRLLDARDVCVNRQRVWMAHHTLRAGDTVDVFVAERPPAAASIPILLDAGGYLIADKPPGLLSNGPGSVEERLQAQLGDSALRAAHRLDRDTSGCLLLARDAKALEAAVAVFRRGEVVKIYHAIVQGALAAGSMRVNQPIDGQHAVTLIRTLDANPRASHVQARLETGRTHQIRRHLATLGHPVVGDREYFTRIRADKRDLSAPRQMLHAFRLELPGLLNGGSLRAQAPLPPDFRRCLAQYRLR
jgi:23S rRNA pseudouridine1911/1915/1917 synthase